MSKKGKMTMKLFIVAVAMTLAALPAHAVVEYEKLSCYNTYSSMVITLDYSINIASVHYSKFDYGPIPDEIVGKIYRERAADLDGVVIVSDDMPRLRWHLVDWQPGASIRLGADPTGTLMQCVPL
jgi:hypothetical protein